jgi:hypothetical protein
LIYTEHPVNWTRRKPDFDKKYLSIRPEDPKSRKKQAANAGKTA